MIADLDDSLDADDAPRCPYCDGSGIVDDLSGKPCDFCKVADMMTDDDPDDDGEPCPYCGGSGEIDDVSGEVCLTCYGWGYL